MPPAIYQYVLHGFGAEKFAVDQRGYLYLNTPGGLDADSNSSTYQLHVSFFKSGVRVWKNNANV